MSLDAVLAEAERLAPEELPILVAFVEALIDAFHTGLSREDAVAAARTAARRAVDALEAATVTGP